MGNPFGRRRSFAKQADRSVDEAAAIVQAEADARYAETRERAAQAKQDEADRPKLTREDVLGSKYVRDRFGWHRVVQVNAKTVSVYTGHSWYDRIPFDRVFEVRNFPPDEGTTNVTDSTAP